MGISTSAGKSYLVCRTETSICAFPLAHLVETMRPLPIQILPDMPASLLGLSIVRGETMPVLDLAALTGDGNGHCASPKRFVCLRSGQRCVCVAVHDVVGVRTLHADAVQQLPPLLRDANADLVSAIGMRDNELLLVLQTAHLVPDAAWNALQAEYA
jgi:purine-binding chemotaxis protein CheW